MAPPRAATTYRKQDGVLAIAKDRKFVSWSPSQPPDAPPTLVINVAFITNLQQTPEKSAKVALKIFVQEPGQAEPVQHVFNFTSGTDARTEANAIKDGLTNAIQAQKSALSAAANNANGGLSAAMTIASAISGGGKVGNLWEDDERLKTDVNLQQSLMKKDLDLQKTFMEARSMKPDSLSNIQFTQQFWASRVHLLRAHAIAESQARGRYNVFSEMRREDGGTKMNLTSEHIRAIFEQYPVMRTIYDEVVPKRCKDEVEFWSRFFQSQLYSTLRGMKVDRAREAKDPLLDQYLDHPELTGLRPTSTELHIPKFIDLEGNEENHSQRQGNAPDAELRQTALDKAPIIRRLNALSEKLMAAVKPSDTDVSAPIGMDEHEYEQLRLQDLTGDPEQQRIILNIRDQSRFFSNNVTTSEDTEVVRLRALDPTKAIQTVCSDLSGKFPQPGTGVLPIVAYESEDEDQFDDDNTSFKAQGGSATATKHILSLIQSHRDQTTDSREKDASKSSGLSPMIYDRLHLTHATTLEFLRQFWSAFLSGDATRTNEIASLVESLNRALDRINTIAIDAQKERDGKISEAREQAKELFKKTGRRMRVDEKAVGGGGDRVRELLGPVIKVLGVAVEKYRILFEEQAKEADMAD